MKKTETNDGKKGGLLKGKPHYDKDGNSLGGIKAIVVDSGKPVELEGGEVIINKEASKKYWKELSKINQSAGNGVPILPPNKYDEDPTEYKDGGRVIDFNPNHVPSKRIINYAKTIKQKHPKIWDLGGNIFGNEAFVNLERVSKRGYWLESEEWMYIKWRSYVARHQHDFRIEGVIAMLKWADIVNKGWAYMKDLIEAKIEKTTKMKKGGAVTETYKQQYNEKYNYKPNESHSLEEIHADTGVSLKGLQEIYNKGIGAYKTNPSSVRPNVKSKEQWAMARVYSAIMGGKASEVDANELKMKEGGKIGGQNSNQIKSLILKAVSENQKIVTYDSIFTSYINWDGKRQYRMQSERNIDKFKIYDSEKEYIKAIMQRVNYYIRRGFPNLIEINDEIVLRDMSFKMEQGGNILTNWNKNISDEGWSSTMDGKNAYENVGGYISDSGNWKIYRSGRWYIRKHDGASDFIRDGSWGIYYKDEFFGNTDSLKEAKDYVDYWIRSRPNEFKQGGNIDKQDSVTMDIPLLIRTLELAREDVKSDAELHHVVENLLKLKNKKVLTMDDYNYIANVKAKHISKMKEGGNVNEAEEKPNFENHLNTYLNNNGIKFEHHNAELEIYNQELELNRLLS